MYTFITILIALVCVLIILVVLVQKPKGGGLSANFSGSNQVMGVKRTTDVIEKTTWILSLSLLVLTLLVNIWIPRSNDANVPSSALKEQAENAPVNNLPNAQNPAEGAEQAPAAAGQAQPEQQAKPAN
jgi:preprotein translocase subunit SecG